VLCVQANPDGQELEPTGTCAAEEARSRRCAKRNMENLPRLYNKYIGHDDNRDFYMSNMKETTNMNRQLFLEWFPQIMYNHHQTGPAGAVIFMPPFRDPFNYNFDPLVPLGIEMVGTAMHSRLVAEGKGGSAMRSGSNYSTWWNGGLRTITYFHNMIGILTEIIGSPTPMNIPLVPESSCRRAIGPCRSRRRPWHYRQSIDYEITNNRAILDLASRYRETFLFNIWRMGMNSIERAARITGPSRPSASKRWKRAPARQAGDAAAAAGADAGAARCGDAAPSGWGGRWRRTRRWRRSHGSLRHGPARSQNARSARLHHSLRSARFRHRHRVRQRAAQERHHLSESATAHSRWRQELSGRLVRGQDRAGLPAARDGHVRAAGPPQRFRYPGGPPNRPTTSPAGRWPCRWA
jgi:hypothetical protein